MVQNGLKWSKNAQDGPKWSKITKNGENCQNSPKQCWTNILIFKYILTYLGKYIHLPNYLLTFSRANLFGYSFVITFHDEYIQIFIRSISMVTNIFIYSFVQKNYIHPHFCRKEEINNNTN